MTSQIFGAFLGGLLSWALLDAKGAPSIPLKDTEKWWRFATGEFIGTFSFVFAVLILVRTQCIYKGTNDLTRILFVTLALTFSR